MEFGRRRLLYGEPMFETVEPASGSLSALFVSAILAYWTPVTGAIAAESTVDVHTLKTICPPALKKLESAYDSMRGSGKRTFTNTVGGIHQRIENFEIVFDGKRRRLVETGVKDTFRESQTALHVTTAFVAAPELCFRLRRTSAMEGYSTVWMSSGASEASYRDILESIDAHNYQLNRPYCLPTDLKLSVLIQHPTFQAKSITLTSAGPRNHVRVEFEARTSANRSDPLYSWRKTAILKGWFVLCPELSWAMEEFEYFHHDGIDLVERGTLRYFDGGEFIPRLKCADETLSGNGRAMMRYLTELSEFSFGTSLSDDFAPAAFGLTNPAIYPANSWSGVLGLATLAALSLMAAVLCRYLFRRRTPA